MKCWLGIHQWSHWEEFQRSNIIKPITGGVLGYVFIQKRSCHRCGLQQHKTERIMAE